MLAEFIEYLKGQVGQHTRLTPDTYEAIIHKREDGRGYKQVLRHGHEATE